MKYIEVVASINSVETVGAIAQKVNATDFRLGVTGDDGQQRMRLLVVDEKLQEALDALQSILGAQPSARILVLPVETSLPKPEEEPGKKEKAATASREALFESVAKGARLDQNYAVLVVLSTIVATIGLIENNVAVVIGAMVIAPLLGPNLALSLGTALGDTELMRQSIKTACAGFSIVFALSICLGFVWPDPLDSHELMLRTDAGLDAMALALASGAAAALSLTTGLSSVLVGVMVAVALLPPAATLGLMLGAGNYNLAAGAGLLLAINIVCVNLSSKLVFFVKGIRPRTWLEKHQARRSMKVYVMGWIISLALLTAAVYARKLWLS